MAAVTLLEIPVYPYVKKFLAVEIDTAPLMVGARNHYARFLYASLERYGWLDAQLPRKYDKLTASLTLGLSAWIVRHGPGAKLSPMKISIFNNFVSQLFWEKLEYEVSLCTRFGLGLRVSTEQFLARYGITENELDLDTVLRYYARYHRRKLSHLEVTKYCPDPPANSAVILPYDRDRTIGQVESGRGQAA